MQRRFDIVLFDLGHTLLRFDAEWPEVRARSSQELVRALNEAGYSVTGDRFIEDLHQRFDQHYAYRENVWKEYTTEGILTGLMRDYGHSNIPAEKLRPAIDAMYAVSQAHWQLEEDAIPMLERLQEEGYRLGIISNAGDDQDVQTLIDQSGIRGYFDIIIVSAAAGIRKPAPDIFHMALKHWQAAPQQAVMIGDTLNADVLGAQNVGMCNVWITRRAERPDNLAFQETIRPDAAIETLSALPELLKSWNGRGAK